ncbi:MAG: DUF1553 domain-containing protein [Bacteroidetes bacterium]|nr:DUF1553 domain-containing protein [Bacteroidota bacterium]
MLNKKWIITGGIGLILSAIYFWYNKDTPGAVDATALVDYNLHVRPILSDKCFACHGPDAKARQAGLRLDIADSAYARLKENPTMHAVFPKDRNKSGLWLRINSKDPELIMPPPKANLTLTAEEIEILGKWIDQGAIYKPHWAFLKPVKPEIPVVRKKNWPKNEIDYFVLAEMEKRGLSPAEQADPERLFKRINLDLTGLLPDVNSQENFLKNPSPENFKKEVRKLLASPHYGEKMAISWMDVARYADSHGYQDDGLRTMWPWRDWVIHAFNENYSYKKFVSWQIAGDYIDPDNKEAILATGFNRNHKITQEGGVIQEEYRTEYVTDRTNTFSKSFLGLTLECAKCHDHKYDPVSQEEYYKTFAFFNQVDEKGLVGDISLASLADPPLIKISKKEVDELLRFINLQDTMVSVMVMKDLDQRRPTAVLRRGQYDQPDKIVGFGVPAAVLPYDTVKYNPNRKGLSDWMFDDNNPLVARVFVNRVWENFFGRGLVKTSGDFGLQGDLPSHPALLDWLAVDFKEHNWDIKRLVRQIVTSATYQQAAHVSLDKIKKDPENIWLSRAPRLRLPAELIKDLIMVSSGLFNPEIGGPSVKPYQPDGIWESTTSGRGQLATYIQDHGKSLYRRGLYNFIKRTAPPPSMLTFDGPPRDQCEISRPRTNTPLQALILLNDPMVNEAARVFAEKLMKNNKGNVDEMISLAFRGIVCRKAKSKEINTLTTFYKEQYTYFSSKSGQAEKIVNQGEYPHEKLKDKNAVASLALTILTIYNLEESISKT